MHDSRTLNVTSENHFQTDEKIASVSIAVLGSEFPTYTAYNKRIHITRRDLLLQYRTCFV